MGGSMYLLLVSLRITFLVRAREGRKEKKERGRVRRRKEGTEGGTEGRRKREDLLNFVKPISL